MEQIYFAIPAIQTGDLRNCEKCGYLFYGTQKNQDLAKYLKCQNCRESYVFNLCCMPMLPFFTTYYKLI